MTRPVLLREGPRPEPRGLGLGQSRRAWAIPGYRLLHHFGPFGPGTRPWRSLTGPADALAGLAVVLGVLGLVLVVAGLWR